jgi:hypothetical protein
MFAFLKLIPARFFIYAAIAAAFAFVLLREKWAVDKAKRLSAENTQLVATIAGIEKAREIERQDRSKADETAKNLDAELTRIRSEPRITGVRICPRRDVSAESGTSPGTESTLAGRVEGTLTEDPGRDVSDAVDAYATDCAAVAAVARAWQEWDSQRTH